MGSTEAPTEPAIPAATVLLLRDAPGLEVLMIRRHTAIQFAGGAMVFPGGRVDPGDHDETWRTHAVGLAADPIMAAGQIAAIREAFEEARILLARPRGGAAMIDPQRLESLNAWRKKVEADDRAFLELIQQEDLVIAADSLTFFAHWVAPPRMHKRFDTLFFAARTPPGQIAEQDGDEATEAVWVDPAGVLAEADAGTRKLIFPTRRNVELLGVSRSVDTALQSARDRPIRPICPTVVQRDGAAILTIPDDLGYPITEEALDSAFRD